MRKLLFIGLMLFMAGNVFCQTLSKEQEKQVKDIHKQVQKEHDAVIKDPTMTAEEKKSRINASKDKRDAQLENVMTPEQAAAVKAKDPVNWDKANAQVDKQESAKLKAEMNEKLDELEKQGKELTKKENDIDAQMKELKKSQADIETQQKALKQQRKEVKAQYSK